jgi:hypothetical protein
MISFLNLPGSAQLTSGSKSLIRGYKSFPTFALQRFMNFCKVSFLRLASSLLILSIIMQKT